MAAVLLSDPVLQMLSPLDLMKVRQVCKEAYDVVEDYRATQSHYIVKKKPTLPWKTRGYLYNYYPAVTHLTVELGDCETTTIYLRPTLHSVHLTFPLQLSRLAHYNEWYLRNTWDFTDALKQIVEFLEANPEAELNTVRFSFQSTVAFILEDGRETIVDYDQGYPIYESEDIWARTESKSPEDYFWLVDPSQSNLREIHEALAKLAGLRKWKRFEIPEAFPGSTLCATATIIKSNPYDEEEFEFLEEYVYRLFHQN